MGNSIENIGPSQFLRNTFPLSCTAAKCSPYSLSDIARRGESEISPSACNIPMAGKRMTSYTAGHARAGITAKLPMLEVWPNQFPGYRISTRFPEYSSVCPKTGMPDYGSILIEYEPRRYCLELKSLKLYLLGYRNLGIFYENAVNRILKDVVAAARPVWCVVRGEFTPRGGLTTAVEARFPRGLKRP
jgi:7-cyano-7-deazaguanine reductase